MKICILVLSVASTFTISSGSLKVKSPRSVEMKYVKPTSAEVTWVPDQAKSIAGYRVFLNDTFLGKLPANAKSYNMEQLQPHKTYKFEVETFMLEGGKTFYSNPETLRFTTDTPRSPNNFIVKTVRSTSVEVSWENDQHDVIDEYQIYVNDSLVQSVSGNALSCKIPGLQRNKVYKLTIEAIRKDRGATYYSSPQSSYVKLETPEPPHSLKIKSVNSTSVQITWIPDKTKPITGYVLKINDYYIKENDDVGPKILNSSQQSYTIPTLQPDTYYTFSIEAIHVGAISRSISDQVTLNFTTNLPPPGNLGVEEIGSTSVLVKWNHTYNLRKPITGYKLYLYDEFIKDFSKDIVSYRYEGLEQITDYKLILKAFRNGRHSVESDPATVSFTTVRDDGEDDGATASQISGVFIILISLWMYFWLPKLR